MNDDFQEMDVQWVSDLPVGSLRSVVAGMVPPGDWVSLKRFAALLFAGERQLLLLGGPVVKSRPEVYISRDLSRLALGDVRHPITHISRLPELPRIAGAFYKDGDLLETQPDGFGSGLAVVSAGEEAAALGNQA